MRLDLIVLLPALLLIFFVPRPLTDQALPNADVSVRVDEQRASHILFRRNLVAAHLNILSGSTGRILTAFPAGNSGNAVWVHSPHGEVTLDWAKFPETPGGRVQSVTFEVTANQDELVISQAVLGSVRSIREWDIDRLKPQELNETVEFNGSREVILHRRGLDQKVEYKMIIAAPEGTVRQLADGHVALASDRAGAPLRLRVTSISTETALTPIPAVNLLKPEVLARTDERSIQLLSFLMYREKFLAGSWTYLTYFGRDTLLTLRFLIHSLQPEAIESMLGAVIDRLREDGDVAHEEEIGDYAALRNHRRGLGYTSKPFFDYRMVDDDFLLSPVLAVYVREVDPERVGAFFARRTPGGRSYRDAVLSNIGLVERRAAPFTHDPTWRNLISLPVGQPEGNWRDSHPGVGWGRYVYDVNAALVPAALKAARVLLATPALDAVDDRRSAHLMQAAQVWESQAPRLFRVEVSKDTADSRAEAYMRTQSLLVPASPARPIVFNGISLDENGRVIPVMHSDEGFLMMFGDPPEEVLLNIADTLVAPFPFGLRSDVGMLVANPAFGDEKLQVSFTAQHYHGTVVWSWQQAMMAAALRRQIERADISKLTRQKLEAAEVRTWELITRTEKYRSAELWTWKPERGTMSYIPFGQNAGDHSESNPNQGWSHAFIGVRPPPNMGKSEQPLNPSN